MHVEFKRGSKVLASVDLPSIPRVGENVLMPNGKTHSIRKVLWTIADQHEGAEQHQVTIFLDAGRDHSKYRGR